MKSSGFSSEELYDHCRKGSEEAWFEASKYVCSIVSRDCWHLHEKEREEIVNDTLLYFLSGGLEKVEHPKAYKKLLKLKAKGLAIDHRRSSVLLVIQNPPKGEHGETLSPEDLFPPVEPEGEGMIFNRQAIKVCVSIINSLKKECREILPPYFRYKVLGHGVGQLAKDLKKPLGSVASSVHRCLKKLYSHPQILMLRQEFLGGTI